MKRRRAHFRGCLQLPVPARMSTAVRANVEPSNKQTIREALFARGYESRTNFDLGVGKTATSTPCQEDGVHNFMEAAHAPQKGQARAGGAGRAASIMGTKSNAGQRARGNL